MRASLVVAVGSLLGTTNAAAGSADEPFPTRDQNPLLVTFGLPMPLASRIHAATPWSSRLDANWASTELLQSSDDGDVLLVDAETFEARWTLQRALSDRVALRLEVPWRHIGAGRLDGFIDDWHDLFGLPEGARPDLPADEMHIYYGSQGTPELDVDDREYRRDERDRHGRLEQRDRARPRHLRRPEDLPALRPVRAARRPERRLAGDRPLSRGRGSAGRRSSGPRRRHAGLRGLGHRRAAQGDDDHTGQAHRQPSANFHLLAPFESMHGTACLPRLSIYFLV